MDNTKPILQCQIEEYPFITERPEIYRALRDYVERGIPPSGHFVNALLENDLVLSVRYADPDNRRRLDEYVLYLYNEIPANCWGSPEKIKGHLKSFHTPPSNSKMYIIPE